MKLTEKDFKDQPLPWENVTPPPDTNKPVYYTRESALEFMVHLNNLPFLSKDHFHNLIIDLGQQGWSNTMITNVIKEAARKSNWNYNSYIKQRAESEGKTFNQVSK